MRWFDDRRGDHGHQHDCRLSRFAWFTHIRTTDDGVLHIQVEVNTVTFDGGDNVGIGTATPQAMLDVAGNMRVGGSLTVWGTFRPVRRQVEADIRPLERGARKSACAARN